jgi:hypothetical protein
MLGLIDTKTKQIVAKEARNSLKLGCTSFLGETKHSLKLAIPYQA